MIKDIVKDETFLAKPSVEATHDDIDIAYDLIDTLKANNDKCVGLAANMIGISKRIIVVEHDGQPLIMFNPIITKQKDIYETNESCLSLTGSRTTKRYNYIKVEYLNLEFKKRIQTYTGWTAQIIQHEIDHCNGIII